MTLNTNLCGVAITNLTGEIVTCTKPVGHAAAHVSVDEARGRSFQWPQVLPPMAEQLATAMIECGASGYDTCICHDDLPEARAALATAQQRIAELERQKDEWIMTLQDAAAEWKSLHASITTERDVAQQQVRDLRAALERIVYTLMSKHIYSGVLMDRSLDIAQAALAATAEPEAGR